MSAIATAVVGSAVVGAYSANKASKAQQSAANSANETQLEMYYQSRDDQEPWRNVGENSLNRLQYMLGLQPTSTATTVKGPSQAEIAGQIRDAFPNWMGANVVSDAELVANFEQNAQQLFDGDDLGGERLYGNQLADVKNIYANLMKSREAEEAARVQEPIAAADPEFGSLLRNFSEKDFWDDPVTKLGFQFGIDEGTKGLNRQFSASGSRDSGSALKALTRFATDYTGTKGNEAFNRFNINRDSTYNKLASLAGVGQTAAQQTGSQAVATGQSVGNNIIGAGNARAASSIGMGNAITGGIGQGINMWQQNQLMRQQPSYVPYVNNAYSNGFGDAFTNMSNPAYG